MLCLLSVHWKSDRYELWYFFYCLIGDGDTEGVDIDTF